MLGIGGFVEDQGLLWGISSKLAKQSRLSSRQSSNLADERGCVVKMNCKWRAVKVDEYGGSFVLHSFKILKGASLPDLKFFMEKQSILDPRDIEEAAGSGYFNRRENTLPFVERVLGIMGRLKDPKVGSTKLDLPWQAIADKICGVEIQEVEV